MKKPKIKEREVAKIEYFVFCPVCDIEIRGTSPGQTDYNLKTHLDTHKRKKKNEKKTSRKKRA